MELRHLRYFLAVAEELHFTRAAIRLHIGQPPLSQQIQALERELGVQLFVRTKRSVRLTEAGQHLLVRAREIIGSSQEIIPELQQIASGGRGELRIGFTASGLLSQEVRQALHAFHDQCPQVSLRLHEMYTYRQFEALEHGELDIGFVRLNSPLTLPGLDFRLIRHDRLSLIVPAHHPFAGRQSIRLAECRNEAFISYPLNAGASLTEHLARLCAQAGFVPDIVQEAREAGTQIGLVASGIGVTVLAEPLARLALEDICFIPIEDAGAYMDMLAVWRKEDPSPRVRRFLHILSSHMQKNVTENMNFQQDSD